MVQNGVKDGELVFVTGHPGFYVQAEHRGSLESLRETSIPLLLRMLESRRATLKRYMAPGEERRAVRKRIELDRE